MFFFFMDPKLPAEIPLRLSPDDLRRVGEPVFGPRWQSQMAEALSTVSGRQVPQSRLAQWLLEGPGGRPTPPWVPPQLLQVARQGRQELLDRIAALDEFLAEYEPRVKVAIAEGDQP